MVFQFLVDHNTLTSVALQQPKQAQRCSKKDVYLRKQRTSFPSVDIFLPTYSIRFYPASIFIMHMNTTGKKLVKETLTVFGFLNSLQLI